MKFFRRFRENILPGKGVKKYFLYAIGEIVLVVVGILIALWINSVKTTKAYEASEKQLLKDITAQLIKDEADVMRFQKVVAKRNRSFMYYSKDKEALEREGKIKLPLLYELDLSKLKIDPVVVSSIENFDFKRGGISLKCTAILSDYKYAQNRIDQLENDMLATHTKFTTYLGENYDWYIDYSFDNHIVSESTDYFFYNPEYKRFIARMNTISSKQYTNELESYKQTIGNYIYELKELLKER